MLATEYSDLRCTKELGLVIEGADLVNKTNRTLLYGYTCERETAHVYLEDGVIHSVVYSYQDEILAHTTQHQMKNNQQYSIFKRVYPAASDAEFAKLLKLAGVFVPYTTFDTRVPQAFYGLVARQLRPKVAKAHFCTPADFDFPQSIYN